LKPRDGQKQFVTGNPQTEKLAEADISIPDTTFRQRDVRANGEKRPMKPYRIQLKRTKGWCMPANTVKVDRSTKWGNPFKVDYKGMTPELAVQSFKNVLAEFGEYLISSRVKVTIDDIKRELRGKNLACWCKLSEVCHADVLLEIANG
jgi:Domain of unknown function (DUF4326)